MSRGFFVGVAGNNTDIRRAFIGVGGAWRTVRRGFVGVGGAWRLFYVNFAVSLSSTSETSGIPSSGFAVSDPVSVIIDGGTGPFSYVWQRISGNPTIQITSQTAGATTFAATLFDGQVKVGTFACNVTDTATNEILQTETVEVTLFSDDPN